MERVLVPINILLRQFFRSIESRKFVIRSANKGKSVFVDPYGKIIKELEPTETGNIELELPILESSEKTIQKKFDILLAFNYICLHIFCIT